MLTRRPLFALCALFALSACSEHGIKPILAEPDGPPATIDDDPLVPGDDDPDANDDEDPQDPVDPPTEPATPPATTDSDGDGLSDTEEAGLGTDPNLVDTDGDGYDDLEELDQNTDPLAAVDHPYAGGWAIGDCHASVVSTGNNPGQIAQDFALTDQHGDTVHLHDFCDRAVLLVSSASWCGPCQQEAPELQWMYEDLEAQGFIPITLLGEGDPAGWANALGLEYPVLSDPGYAITTRFTGPGSISLPAMHLLGPGAEVIIADGWVSESTVVSALP